MSKLNDLTTQALAGYSGAANPHILSSSWWLAHHLGAYLRKAGKAAPADVRMSRGNSLWSGGQRWKLIGCGMFKRVPQ